MSFFRTALLFFFCCTTISLVFILLLTSSSFCSLRFSELCSFSLSRLTKFCFRELLQPSRFSLLPLLFLFFVSCPSFLPEFSLLLDVASQSCFFVLTILLFLLRLTASRSFRQLRLIATSFSLLQLPYRVGRCFLSVRFFLLLLQNRFRFSLSSPIIVLVLMATFPLLRKLQPLLQLINELNSIFRQSRICFYSF